MPLPARKSGVDEDEESTFNKAKSLVVSNDLTTALLPSTFILLQLLTT
jgi:hypothetical protein